MADGPGIYDDLCTQVREQTQAVGVVLLIVNGNLGSGFSVQTKNPALNDELPNMLEDMAKLIREDGYHIREN